MLALERHVGHFQEEEIKKIFDKDYYEKYAAHVVRIFSRSQSSRQPTSSCTKIYPSRQR